MYLYSIPMSPTTLHDKYSTTPSREGQHPDARRSGDRKVHTQTHTNTRFTLVKFNADMYSHMWTHILYAHTQSIWQLNETDRKMSVCKSNIWVAKWPGGAKRLTRFSEQCSVSEFRCTGEFAVWYTDGISAVSTFHSMCHSFEQWNYLTIDYHYNLKHNEHSET